MVLLLNLIKDLALASKDVRQIKNEVKAIYSSNVSCETFENMVLYLYKERKLNAFQKSVLIEICKIPCGQVLSYKAIAEKIQKPKAYRAVATACATNKFPILIPCHRVIGSSGIGGYTVLLESIKKNFDGQSNIEIKKQLLEYEKNL